MQLHALEYRLVWSDLARGWHVLRNGEDTGIVRRKKQSGIDLAVQFIKATAGAENATAVVLSIKNGVTAVEWSS